MTTIESDMNSSDLGEKKKLALIGASGFVGRHFIEKFHDKYHIVAISRTKSDSWPDDVEWIQTDLFSAQSIKDGIKDVDIAVYLVHSMIPSTRLFQGNFADTDLLLADNFVRSCRHNGVKKIVYLSGPVPKKNISKHLKSRAEVEKVFFESGIESQSIRAGMVVGRGGSSYEILENLVKRLPVMVLPKWTKNRTHCIHVLDLIEIIHRTISDSRFNEPVINAVTGENLTYSRLIKIMAKAQGKKIICINLPINSIEFSKRWVSFFGNSPYVLVSPLIDSLSCKLPKVEVSNMMKSVLKYRRFSKMAEKEFKISVKKDKKKFYQRKQHSDEQKEYNKKIQNTVRSIQRLPSLPHKSSQWISNQYMKFLPNFLKPFIKIKINEKKELVHFLLIFLPKPLLTLKLIKDEKDPDRQKFFIVSGLLTKTKDTGWLEFRQVSNKKYTLAAIHEFYPTLPWFIYIYTQAIFHEKVMFAFAKYLAKFKKKRKRN